MKQILLFILLSVAFCAGQQTNDTRCSIHDEKCQLNLFQSIATVYGKTGIKDKGVPVIEPLKLCNINMPILGLVNLTLFEGVAEGISNCIVTKLENNVEGRYRRPEMICSKITIRGRYKLTPTPVMGNICGWCNINGGGNGSIVLEDWGFKFNYSFEFVRRDDGNIYFNGLFDKAVHEVSVKKVTVDADCIKSGKHDITRSVVTFINNNWRTLIDSYIGEYIYEIASQYYYKIYKIFYETSPAITIYTDDVEQLLKIGLNNS